MLRTLIFLTSLFWMPALQAGDFAFGLGAMEEGDDRFRPSAFIHYAPDDKKFGRAHFYGRDFGPVSERTYLISAAMKYPSGLVKSLNAGLGVVGMLEQFTVANTDEEKTENQFNAGGLFGLYYELKAGKKFFSTVGWESHVFPAGQAAIFLVSGRKHVVSLAMGMSL